MDEILEQRICIKFCFKLGKTANETHKMLVQAFGESSMKKTSAFEWYSRFKNGRISVNDDERSGRPISMRTPEAVTQITILINEDPKITVREIEEETGLSKSLCATIIKDDLQLKKTPSKFVPMLLSPTQKKIRLETSLNMLEMTELDPMWMEKVITGDETWVYGYDPETKSQSLEWKALNEPKSKKARMSKSKNKVLLVTFIDNQGLVHYEYLPEGTSVNQEVYLGILRRLREAIRQKRPVKWEKGDWILHHDNARPHCAHSILRFLTKNKTQILPQAPYSPDLAPCDFFLFPKLKMALKGRRFYTRNDIIEKSKSELLAIPKRDYKKCFLSWEKRWHKCIDAEGDYFEKY